jgi:hypothetical protein
MMMEAAGTSETSVNFYQTTRRNNPEDNHLNEVDFWSLFLKMESHNLKTGLALT